MLLESTIARSRECAPTEDDDRMPIVGVYRGIGLHDHQTPELVKSVKAAIDRGARMSDIMELADFAADAMQPPEARLFAASKIEINYQLAAEERRNRPSIDLYRLRATVSGLDSIVWRDPERCGSLLDHGGI